MKKLLMVTLSLMIAAGMVTIVQAQEAEAPKKINLKADNIARASKVISQNRALFEDPETMKKILRLSQSLQKTK